MNGVWMHALQLLVVGDLAALFAFFAMVVDGQLLSDQRRGQFSLRSLLLAMTFAAVNLGVIYGMLRAR